MADLDDFFAKKDRKKGKTSKKFSTTDEVAKKLEDNAKKTEKLKKERPTQEGDEISTPIHDQDEWKDFEEEKKDYTGLKIGNLTIASLPEGTNATEPNSEQQDGSNEVGGQDGDRKVGPWKRIDSEVQEEPVKVVERKEAPAPKSGTGGAYVPPSLRNQPTAAPLQPTRLRHGQAAPDIHNEEFFPTLSKTGDPRRNRSEGVFEVVSSNRGGSHRQVEQAKATGQALSLENRYNTLSES